MLWLARLVAIVAVIFVGATLAVHLVGGTRPMPVATLFSNPDGSPCQQACLFGIVPGQTTASDALLILKAHPLSRRVTFTDTEGKIEGVTSDDNSSGGL